MIKDILYVRIIQNPFAFIVRLVKKIYVLIAKKKHLNHDIISYGSILPDIDEE